MLNLKDKEIFKRPGKESESLIKGKNGSEWLHTIDIHTYPHIAMQRYVYMYVTYVYIYEDVYIYM